MKKYEYLKELYPEHISLNQLYQICGISKRSALYLVKHGVIPCTENENKTWRYRIAVDDVITYLRRREQWGSMIPRGAVKNGPRKPKARPAIFSAPKYEVRVYFAKRFSDCPDMLTPQEIAELVGLHRVTVRRFIRDGTLSAIPQGKAYFVTKAAFLDFVATEKFIRCGRSDVFKKIIGGFESWKAAK